MSTPTLSIARGRGDNLGAIQVQTSVTLPALADLLREAQKQPVNFTFEAYQAAAKELRDNMKLAPWYVCATFKGVRRVKDELKACNGVVLDADKAGVTREALTGALDAIGCSYIAVTSTSHGVDGQARYRVIIPLAAPISAEQYAAIWTHLASQVPGIDQGAKDATRLNYMPRIPHGAAGHEVICVEDRPWLDAAAIPQAVPTPAQPAAAAAEARAVDLTAEQVADVRAALAHLAALETESPGAIGPWHHVGYSLLKHGARDLWLEFCEAARGSSSDHGGERFWNIHANSPVESDYRHLFTMASARGWINPAARSVELAKPEDFKPVAAGADILETRKPFTFHSLPDDLLARQLPERCWALFPYLPVETVTMLTSAGGYGKTFAALLLAVCKALGLPNFCDQPCAAGRVVILSAEDDMQEMQRRVQRVLQHLTALGVSVNYPLLRDNLQFVDLTGVGASNMLTRAQQMGAIHTDLPEHIAKQIGRADLIVIDTLSRFNGASENDNQAGAVFVSALEVIAKRTGSAVLVLAHTGKQQAREGVVDQYVSRGASAYSDNSRSGMTLVSPDARHMKELEIDAAAAERGEVFRLVHVKSNYAKRADDVFFQRHDGGVVAPFKPLAKRAENPDELWLRLKSFIGLGAATRNMVKNNYEDIFAEGVTRAKAIETFDRAVRDGALTCTYTKNQASYFKVADPSLRTNVDAPMRSDPPDNFYTKPEFGDHKKEAPSANADDLIGITEGVTT